MIIIIIRFLLLLTLCDLRCASSSVEYGVDVSFPMHHATILENEHDSPLHGRKAFYDDFLRGCVKFYGPRDGSECLETERGRIEMSLRQPQSMKNYTEIGYKKIRAPESLFKIISLFWETNKERESEEEWGIGETFTNHWESPTYMVSVEDERLEFTGYRLRNSIWNQAKTILEEWTGGQELRQTSLYGIRVYKTNSILATHVDRRPLIISAIINVDSDLDEPWPLEVIGHDGKATNVTMEPGDMVLYESHSVLHGRPFPLKGRYVANLFIHFEPTGRSSSQEQDAPNDDDDDDNDDTNKMPVYIIPGSPEAIYWENNPDDVDEEDEEEYDKEEEEEDDGFDRDDDDEEDDDDEDMGDDYETRRTPLHRAASDGDLRGVERILEEGVDGGIDVEDENGWTPLHEASRAGHTDVVQFLLENGANVNMITPYQGDTAIGLAREFHGDDHPIINLLLDNGAIDIGPEL